jgi:hypothetical protein
MPSLGSIERFAGNFFQVAFYVHFLFMKELKVTDNTLRFEQFTEFVHLTSFGVR